MTDTLRIRILAGDLSAFAGGPMFMSDFAIQLADRGHDVSVICFDASDRLSQSCNVNAIVRSPWRDTAIIWRWSYQLDIQHIKRKMKLKMLQPADIVIGFEHLMLLPHHALDSSTPMIYIPLSLIAPLEVKSYGRSGFSQQIGMSLFHKLQVWAIRNAATTIRFTQTSCKMLNEYYADEVQAQYRVIPISIDIPERIEQKPLGVPIRFLSLGRLTDSKNAALLLKSLGDLIDYDWQLDIVGEGPEKENLENLATTLGIASRVRFLGRVEHVSDSYKNADLFLFPSKLDNSPLVLLEAMSFGVPCLAMKANGSTYQNANEEIIAHKEDGLLASSEQDFREILRAILKDPGVLSKLGQTARETVSHRNSWSAFCGELEKTMIEVVATPKQVGT